jgi:hypothetical protein
VNALDDAAHVMTRDEIDPRPASRRWMRAAVTAAAVAAVADVTYGKRQGLRRSVLLYRLVSFWLVMVAGWAVLVYLRLERPVQALAISGRTAS